jgi:hypothetical protein
MAAGATLHGQSALSESMPEWLSERIAQVGQWLVVRHHRCVEMIDAAPFVNAIEEQ